MWRGRCRRAAAPRRQPFCAATMGEADKSGRSCRVCEANKRLPGRRRGSAESGITISSATLFGHIESTSISNQSNLAVEAN